MFDEKTVKMIEDARDAMASGKFTKADKLLVVMSDGQWHMGGELAQRVSWRFGGYLHTLKGRGVAWEKERVPNLKDVVYKYRLKEGDDVIR